MNEDEKIPVLMENFAGEQGENSCLCSATELHELAFVAGIEPATEVSVLYATCELVS